MSVSDPITEGQRVLGLLLAKTGDGSALANELLRAFHRGFPLDNLLPLLESNDPELVRLGAWIQSELGARAIPLASSLPALLRHALKYVRFFALDSVMTCATESDGPLLAAATTLLADSEDAVRWKTVRLLSTLPNQLLQVALSKEQDEEFRHGLRSLLSEDPSRDVPVLISSNSPILRRFGVAAALRSDKDDLLELAAASGDHEIEQIASERLEQKRRER